jgi:hypothetical protein
MNSLGSLICDNNDESVVVVVVVVDGDNKYLPVPLEVFGGISVIYNDLGENTASLYYSLSIHSQ